MFLQYLDIFWCAKRCTIALICIMQCTLAMFQYFFMFLHYFISSRCTIALICSALLQKFDICLCSCNILSAEDSQLHRHDLEYFDISCNISIISYNVFCTRHTFTIFQYFWLEWMLALCMWWKWSNLQPKKLENVRTRDIWCYRNLNFFIRGCTMQILSIVFLKMQRKRHCLRQRFILCAQKGTNAKEDTFIHIWGFLTLNPGQCLQ